MTNVEERAAGLLRIARATPPLVADAALAALVLVVSLAEVAITDDLDDNVAWRTLLLTLMAAVLVVRRRHPVGVWLAEGALAMVYGIGAFTDPSLPYAGLIAVYTVAAHSALKPAMVALAVTLAAVVAALLIDPHDDLADWALGLLSVTVAWLLGTNVRAQRAYGDAMAARAASLERDRAAAEARAAALERLRLARELHDVAAHHVSVIALHAEAGQAALDAEDRPQADRSFTVIADTARSTLTELRQVVGVLRDPGDAPRSPQPGIHQLSELVADVEHAGVVVTLQVHGEPRQLGAAVDASAYRIVQEALTNVLRHAGPARAAVTVTYADDGVELAVLDDGAGPDGRSFAGHGLIGMRERAAAFGGSLTAGGRPGGGFAVHARIPT